ncbi:coordinator of PRMT5 and differentiation stimulator-like [Mustela erminea]|uniref:coordinator of PRMT5 and differentiation stimulator-like n=1 Tax=Mustela erminea TaxID=36723 RepID=UPI001386B303|nr:coordinator of PRMT5 and differentiation stimulator-like [Mustela erminea]
MPVFHGETEQDGPIKENEAVVEHNKENKRQVNRHIKKTDGKRVSHLEIQKRIRELLESCVYDGDLNTWELSEGVSDRPPKEQAADLFNEDWDLELKADQGNPYDADDIQGCISQEVKPWVCCAPQGDMVYDPSWHHPPPLIPHYSKMVFKTGQFDDAED